MGTIDDLLAKLLFGGCDVEIGASKNHGLLLVVKPETCLSSFVGTVMRIPTTIRVRIKDPTMIFQIINFLIQGGHKRL
jgi:hypothetical protein